MRKLFIAKNSKGDKINIDDIGQDNMPITTGQNCIGSHAEADKEHDRFYCPYCNKEVIPRLGSLKEKHFAHKDGFCGVELDSYSGKANAKTTTLSEFSGLEEDPFSRKKLSAGSLVRCSICKDNLRFENAIRIDEDKFICKRCLPRAREIF